MKSMTIVEALSLAHSTFQECAIPMRDAGKASAAVNLLAECIAALKNAPTTEQKEESK